MSDGTWTWLSGSSTGVAGYSCPKGVPVDAEPCGRVEPVLSFDSTNMEIWLYGGNNGGVSGFTGGGTLNSGTMACAVALVAFVNVDSKLPFLDFC